MNRYSWVWAYVVLALIWGWSFALIQISLQSFTPLQVAFGRTALGAMILLLAVGLRRRGRLPSRTEAGHLLLLGGLTLALPFTLIAFAQTQITSILAGLLNAATPLFAGVFISLLIPAERPDRTQLLGLLVGFVGIAVLIGAWDLLDGGFAAPAGVVAMLAAALGYGFGTAFSRVALSSSRLDTMQLGGLQLLAAAILTAALLPVDHRTGTGPISAGNTAALVALGVLGTGAAMALFWHIIRRAGSTIAATVTYAIPVVSTTVGVLVLDEVLLWNQLVGGVIVVVGVVLAQWSQLTARRDFGASPGSPRDAQ